MVLLRATVDAFEVVNDWRGREEGDRPGAIILLFLFILQGFWGGGSVMLVFMLVYMCSTERQS